MSILPYNLEPGGIPGLYKTSDWGTYIIPSSDALISDQVNSIVEFVGLIFEARKQLPPETLKTRLGKIKFKIIYHFKRIFK